MATEKELAQKRFEVQPQEIKVTRITQCLACVHNREGLHCEPWYDIPYAYQSNQEDCPYRKTQE